MIPFQTILALLAVLIAISGCAQRLPPVPGGRAHSTGALATGTPAAATDGKNTTNHQPDANLQTTNSAALSLETPNGASEFDFRFGKEDGTTLYQSLAIKAVDGVKQGKQIKCTHDDKAKDQSIADECVIKMNAKDGTVADLISESEVQKAAAEKVLQDGFVSKSYYLELHQKDDAGALRMVIGAGFGRQIYEAMTVSPVVASGSSRKNGGNIACDKNGEDPKTATYICYLYLHFDTGLLEKPL